MGALAGAVSAHELLASRDCRAWSCVREAATPGGFCSYCSRLDELRRHGLALAWRRLVRTLDPPADAGCSRLVFQAIASALAELVVAGDPSVAELARASRASKRQVQYALAALEKCGLIRRDSRGGRSRTTRYELARPSEVKAQPARALRPSVRRAGRAVARAS